MQAASEVIRVLIERDVLEEAEDELDEVPIRSRRTRTRWSGF